MYVQRKELVLDLREAQQSPEGIYFDKKLALEIVNLFYEANGNYVLLTHPHSHPLELEKQIYVYKNKPEGIFLGSHFRFNIKDSLENDYVFRNAVMYSNWLGVFLDFSTNAEKRFGLGNDISEEEIYDLSRKAIQSVVATGKKVRYTLEHGFKTLSEESRIRGLKLIEVLSEAGVSWINIPDTIGEMNEEKVKKVLKFIKERLEEKNLGYVPLGVHFHNDLDNALKNTKVSLESFVRFFDVTPLGLGERNGISSLVETANMINEMYGEIYDLKPLEEIEAIVLKEFLNNDLKSFIERQSRENKHKHVAGTHVNAILKGISYKANEGNDVILFNYQSGISNTIAILERNGIKVKNEDQKIIKAITERGKEKSIKEKGGIIRDEEIVKLYEEEKARIAA